MSSKSMRVCGGLIVALGASTSPCLAQTRVTSVDELQRILSPGDRITIVTTEASPVEGGFVALDDLALHLRVVDKRTSDHRPQDIAIPVNAIQSLERPPDPVRNGALLGAGIGAATGGAMFFYALAIDRNEVDEWAGPYLGVTAVLTGVGALVGWAIDAARSKPHVTFDAPASRRTAVSVQPRLLPGHGLALAVAISR